MNVPLLDLTAQYETIKDEIEEAVAPVFETQQFINGPPVSALEDAVAAYCGCSRAVGVSSGTDALLCALMTLGIGEGLPGCRAGGTCPGPVEVITTPFTFFATGGSIWRSGARPVFVDIEPETFNIDPSLIEDAVTDHTVAVMPVHLFGQCAAMDPILDIAGRHGLRVIEDAAQAIGAACRGRKAGTMGDAGCFSFFPSKNLGGLGDGGMVVTNDDDLADRLAQCRNHGQTDRYIHGFVGGNFRLDALQAAGLLVKLRHLDEWSAARRAHAAQYDELFAGHERIVTPVVREQNTGIYNQYVIRVPDRDGLRSYLGEHDIGCAVYYPRGLHLQECFSALGYAPGDFPETERACGEVIALPVYPEMSESQVTCVAETVLTFLEST